MGRKLASVSLLSGRSVYAEVSDNSLEIMLYIQIPDVLLLDGLDKAMLFCWNDEEQRRQTQ